MKNILQISLLIQIFINCNLEAQITRYLRSTTKVCDKIEFIDSLEFNTNKQDYSIIDTSFVLEKINGVIKVNGIDTVFKFKDNTSDEEFFEYTIAGRDINKKRVLILGQDYNQDYYYLINQNTNKVDTLIGYPKIFGDKYLCEEGSYTDGSAFIEIWDDKNKELQLLDRFSFIPCDIYDINESYLKNDYLYVRYNLERYLKVKI